ncbi:MAG: response regulator [Pelatocladus maniniholoensis HA4357-MV3]|jgi:chemotaxis family two-component system response regulator PixG|uniref:Protein PatA n=1 Tax=Pelatocladus maniniholoensis HA4357-MV3 TaxID=1117104 RepID=A0A9E3H587_9NOST|nr:response regulator [Pelatocladus maniniholoensis HA4357-MV3]
MNHSQMVVVNKLINEFKSCTQLKYSGKLNIKSVNGQKWIFYYHGGKIIWATAGTHPFRRLRRQIAQYCPNIDIDKIHLHPQELSLDYWDYCLLVFLYNQQKIKPEQMRAVIENTTAELLFDLTQQADFYSISCDRDQEIILEAPVKIIDADMSLKLMQESWQHWLAAGLKNISPNLAPILRKPEQLHKQVSSAVYNNFVTLINGKYTLWDLAVKMKQSVVLVTHSLLPYISKGIIELVEVFDLPLQIIEVNNNSLIKKITTSNSPRIACVNNNLSVSQTLENILIPNGFRFINIQDTVHALPILIEYRPNLIFLNLVQPVTNGYEICAQLRRISLFANTPIVILRDSDSPLDQIRAKVAGSTDLLAKPVSSDKVIDIVCKHTQAFSELVISH